MSPTSSRRPRSPRPSPAGPESGAVGLVGRTHADALRPGSNRLRAGQHPNGKGSAIAGSHEPTFASRHPPGAEIEYAVAVLGRARLAPSSFCEGRWASASGDRSRPKRPGKQRVGTLRRANSQGPAEANGAATLYTPPRRGELIAPRHSPYANTGASMCLWPTIGRHPVGSASDSS
jgi:hypothetical protein